ncbi:MAG: copper chaperone PCu(A)C [Anaerolineae bacterium]|nr:copper chaperone PCu(A)C [Anaerolineae bacterium]
MKLRFLAILLIVALLASCAPQAKSDISVEGVWGRPSPKYPTSGAFYMLIKNSGDAPDKLVSGSSPSCESVELHEMVMKDDGTMGMNLLENPIDIPAGGQVELKVGDLHAMCIMKKDDFQIGAKVELTLNFEKAGEKTVTAEIMDK